MRSVLSNSVEAELKEPHHKDRREWRSLAATNYQSHHARLPFQTGLHADAKMTRCGPKIGQKKKVREIKDKVTTLST